MSDLIQFRAIHLHLTHGQVLAFSRNDYANKATLHPLTVERVGKTSRDVCDHSTPRRKRNYFVNLSNDQFNKWIDLFIFGFKVNININYC